MKIEDFLKIEIGDILQDFDGEIVEVTGIRNCESVGKIIYLNNHHCASQMFHYHFTFLNKGDME